MAELVSGLVAAFCMACLLLAGGSCGGGGDDRLEDVLGREGNGTCEVVECGGTDGVTTGGGVCSCEPTCTFLPDCCPNVCEVCGICR